MASKNKKATGWFKRFCSRYSPLCRGTILKRRYGFGRTIAIVIDDQSLQLAAARQLWHRCRLLNVTKVYIPSAYSGQEKRENFITSEIMRFVREYGGKNARYVLGIGGQESAIRLLNFPAMKRRELDSAVFWEGNKQIPFGLKDSYYGYHLVAQHEGSEPSGLNVVLLATPRKEVHRRLEELKADIRIDGAYHELEAIGQMLPFLDEYQPGKAYTLVNIMKNHTEISFYRGARMEFRHTASIGSDALSSPGEKELVFQEFADALTVEIQNSLDYYVGQFSQILADKILIYGDLCYSEDLVEHLTRHFGLEFRRIPIESWLKTQPKARDYAEQIPVSLGAVALAVARDDMVNLLPNDMREAASVRKFYRVAIPAVATLLFILFGTWMSLRQHVATEQFHLGLRQNQLERLRNSPSFVMYNRLKQQLTANRQLMEKLDRDPTFMNLNFKELSLITPPQIRLDLLDLQNAGDRLSLALNGEARSATTPPEVIVAEFVARLEGSPFYRNVALRKHSKRAVQGAFSIEFLVEMDTVI